METSGEPAAGRFADPLEMIVLPSRIVNVTWSEGGGPQKGGHGKSPRSAKTSDIPIVEARNKPANMPRNVRRGNLIQSNYISFCQQLLITLFVLPFNDVAGIDDCL